MRLHAGRNDHYHYPLKVSVLQGFKIYARKPYSKHDSSVEVIVSVPLYSFVRLALSGTVYSLAFILQGQRWLR